jgi:hypothetical protein
VVRRFAEQPPFVDRRIFLAHEEFLHCEAMNSRRDEILAGACRFRTLIEPKARSVSLVPF